MSAEDNFCTHSISSLAAEMARGELSSERLLQSCLERINKYDPVLEAFTQIFVDSAVRQARLLDGERKRGGARGPLHGIPVVFKDLVDIAGRSTSAGSRLFEGYVADGTATVAARLEAAGMVTLGKTRMVELAFGSWGTNAVQGTPQNPWDAACHRVPGGSSSGAAVAVAAGLAPVAIGTDTGGSVRIPAALCGLVGLKPTARKIPMDRIVPLSESLDTVGPIARSVSDAALVFDALTGESTANDLRSVLRADRNTCRVGVLGAADLDDMDKEVLSSYRDMIEIFRNLGADVQEFSFGLSLEDFSERAGTFIAYEGWRNHEARIQSAPDRMDPHVLARFRAGEVITPGEYHVALLKREQARNDIASSLEGFDAVLTPTTPITAIPVEDVDENAVPLARFTRFVNYLGLCALSLPAGLDGNGMPISVQLIGRPDSESRLLNIGFACEKARGAFPLPDLAGFES